MAQCQRCGKKGLFLKLDKDGFCSECHEEIKQFLIKQEQHIAKLDDELSHQDELLELVLKARDEYSQDGDVQKIIEVMEKALVTEKPPLLNAQGHTVFLIDLYKKSGQNDKAWALLNSCLLDPSMYEGRTRLPQEKIRLEMAKILKSEGKYSDAIEMYMLLHLQKATWTGFNEERFRKDIKPCISKLKWDENVVSDIVALLEETISAGKNPSAAEKDLLKQYRTYLKSSNLIEEWVCRFNDSE